MCLDLHEDRRRMHIVSDEPVIEAAGALLTLACGLSETDRVVIAVDDNTDSDIIDPFCRAVSDITSHCNLKNANVFCSAQNASTEEPFKNLANPTLLVDLGSRYLLHSAWLRASLRTGMRYACFPEVCTAFLRAHVRNIEHYAAVQERSRRLANRMQTAHRIGLVSPLGDTLECSLDGARIDDAGRRVATPGSVTYLSGQVSFYPPPSAVTGTMLIQGIASPLGPLQQSLHVRIENGMVVDVQGGEEASQLSLWLRERETPWIRHLSHLSLGVFPGVEMTRSTVLSERAEGAVVVGVGAQPPGLGLFPAIQTGDTPHWDLVTMGYEVRLDDEVLF